MTRLASKSLIRIAVAALALALAAAAGCTPVAMGVGTAAFTAPQAVTGRNSFYWIDRTFGRSCSDVSYFDRPVRCVNDRS